MVALVMHRTGLDSEVVRSRLQTRGERDTAPHQCILLKRGFLSAAQENAA